MNRPPTILLLLLFASISFHAFGQGAATDASGEKTYEQHLAGARQHDGFLELHTDPERGTILAALPAAGTDGEILRFIHVLRLTRGLGSNPLGLDRGWGDDGRILVVRRIGDRVLFEADNLRYRARTDNVLERNAVAESFARAFIWSSEILAEHKDGRVLIDLGGFLTRDGLGLARRLSSDGGPFKPADDRSLPDASSVLVFPDNVEIDAWITFAGDEPGAQIRATSADPNSVTLVQHHSFVRLPDDGYRVRLADPRSGTFEQGFRDFAAPLDAPIVQSYAVRHRLQHNEAGRPESGVAEPLVFYIDPGAPERIREALVDGASWWAEAFAAAGFENGYRVELLPEGIHPLDVRYNVVQWVHRQTRGWSYGGGIIDPRTGEMIKGHVILGSQRVRQDRMIFEGLAGVAATGTGADDDPVELSLDRIRQLSAHEVGHALGFGHNFAASSNDRASVMDYPAPWVDVRDGELDFSRSYDRGIGEWDKYSAKWLYTEFPPGHEESEALDAILAEAFESGLQYIADEHGRNVGEAHPDASVWDNGADAVEELARVMAVRAHALERFGPDRISAGRPMSELREVLVPIYLYHRYQVAAAAKFLGGIQFAYAKRGVPAQPATPVEAADQLRALEALIGTLAPSALRVPEDLAGQMPPGTRGFGFSESAPETLASRTEPVFDPFTAAESAADISLAALLHPRRAERLVRQHAMNDDLPSLNSVLEAIEEQVVSGLPRSVDAADRVIAQRVAARYASALMRLDSSNASPEVRATARAGLDALVDGLPRRADQDFAAWLTRHVRGHLERPAPPSEPVTEGPEAPPGSPIGSEPGASEACWHCD